MLIRLLLILLATRFTLSQAQCHVPSLLADEINRVNVTCPPGTVFNFQQCECVNSPDAVVANNNNKLCQLYLPFDNDPHDRSQNHYLTQAHGAWKIDKQFYARGSGALRLAGGRVTIPGIQAIDLSKAATWCFFYCFPLEKKCERGSRQCRNGGGILSNRYISPDSRMSEFSIVAGQDSGGAFDVHVQLSAGEIVFHDLKPAKEDDTYFTPVCVVFNGTYVSITISDTSDTGYEKIIRTKAQPTVSPSPSGYTIGHDDLYGDFHGWLDELLICDRALTKEEIQMHHNGSTAMQEGGLV